MKLCEATPTIRKTLLSMKLTALGTDPIPLNKASGIGSERKCGGG
jgi:hypothetical protein